MCFVNFRTFLLTFPIYPLNSYTLDTRYLGIYLTTSYGGMMYNLGIIDSRITSSHEHFPRYWPFVRGIHRWPVNSPHKGQWRGALMFSLICAWINSWVNNREAGDLRRHRVHYDVIVMWGNGLSPVWRQGLLWSYADWFSIGDARDKFQWNPKAIDSSICFNIALLLSEQTSPRLRIIGYASTAHFIGFFSS